MCPDSDENKDINEKRENNSNITYNGNKEVNYNKFETERNASTVIAHNFQSGDLNVVLQTLKLWVVGPGGKKIVRALCDTGSQRSYITKRCVEKLKFKSYAREKLKHSLFGGVETEIKNHRLYKVKLKSLKTTFSINAVVMDQELICKDLPSVRKEYGKKLQEKGVELSDTDDANSPIELLLGADILGSLFTENIILIDKELTAMKTKFGWTLMGQLSRKEMSGSSLSTIMYNVTNDIADLWRLDVLGIEDPIETKDKDQNSLSLNSCLETGPNLIKLIPTILNGFRLGKFGVIADIKKAFLQIAVTVEDRDSLRFLWWKDYDQKITKVYRHCRVVFGLSSSPFLLMTTLNYHLDNVSEKLRETANQLKSSFYVDNCVASVNSETEIQKFIKEANEIMDLAKMELRGWVHNVQEDDNSMEPCGVLGLMWNPRDDTLYCELKDIMDDLNRSLTERVLLSVAQKLFDPIGFTSPVTLIPKLLLQKLWTLKLKWDDPVPAEVEREFQRWRNELKFVEMCKIPRWYSVDIRCEISIHTFMDASKHAYSACVFIRVVHSDCVRVQLMQCKSKVATKGAASIPRLELLAAVVGVRLHQSVVRAVQFQSFRSYFWSDSMVVLAWIKRNQPWKMFVSNRVEEIRLYSNVDDWYHVPGICNPADLPSRGCNGLHLFQSRWWNGPRWLEKEEDQWPNRDFVPIVSEEEKLQIGAEVGKYISVIVVTVDQDNDFIYNLASKIGKFNKIVRVLAWCLRYINNLKNRKLTGELTVDKLRWSELVLCKIQGVPA